MCSITDATPAPVTVAGLAALVEHAREVTAAVAAALASDPTLLASVPDALLESLALDLHAAHDSADAAATVVTGRVDQQIGSVQGLLIGGRSRPRAGGWSPRPRCPRKRPGRRSGGAVTWCRTRRGSPMRGWPVRSRVGSCVR